MHDADLNRVVFFSKHDLAGAHYLTKGEAVLRSPIKSSYADINDILEFYNIKQYIDNELYLKDWTEENIIEFRQKTTEYGKVIGQFMSGVDDSTVIEYHKNLSREYVNSFWEIANDHKLFKKISKESFTTILSNEPHLIHTILAYKNIVEHYNVELKLFLLTYSKSAEILLSVYEVKDGEHIKFIPKSLTVEDKESIISKYLDSSDVNFNYIELIQIARSRPEFKLSDKTRLKAKRLHESETEKFFGDSEGIKYGVSVVFPENLPNLKEGYVEDHIAHYSYSMDFIQQHTDPYSLFQNFKLLFEYLDAQNRVRLVSKKNQMSVMERIVGVHSQNEYRTGIQFRLSEMTSHIQIVSYKKIVNEVNNSLENILHHVFTSSFQEKYGFADNARFSIPSAINSNFEKVRLLAPEFESALKQYKLFVEDGSVDFELLQISSSPATLKDIPSLNQNKYIYPNEQNEVLVAVSNLFFSDQTSLAYVDPFKEKQYHNFFDLLAKEQVKFTNYAEYQKTKLSYLVDKGLISIDGDDHIQIVNPKRLAILKDLYNNEVASLHRYPSDFQNEARQMAAENLVNFDKSLFSKPEQAYFNYVLNKSEFTNGLDLRNSYLHGTQANPDDIQKHEYAYFTYLKLLFLTMLKIEDDLEISKTTKK